MSIVQILRPSNQPTHVSLSYTAQCLPPLDNLSPAGEYSHSCINLTPSNMHQNPQLMAASVSQQQPDLFYGHEHTSRLCTEFITHLFACPKLLPSSSGSTVKLLYFIYALHRTKWLPSVITFAALVFCQHLKARFPTARESLGHHLFISVFLASKVICNDTYSNKSWSIIMWGMVQLREIN